MKDNQDIQRLVQIHKSLQPFDYKIAVDWAIDLIRQGNETDNVLMLASFTEPIDKYDIIPYVTTVLNELGLEEIECGDALIAQTHFLLLNILRDQTIRENLQALHQICINNHFDERVYDFYLLHHAWWELECDGANNYYEGANLNNIEFILKLEARIWIDKYIYRKENQDLQQELKALIDTPIALANNMTFAKSNGDTNKHKVKQPWWRSMWG